MSRFTTRYADLDSDHLAWMLVSVDGRLSQRMDENDYRSYDDYYQRAQLRYGAGFPAYEVLDDLWAAGRCLRFEERLHLSHTALRKCQHRLYVKLRAQNRTEALNHWREKRPQEPNLAIPDRAGRRDGVKGA